MPDRRGYLDRLRSDGGPSHELLVLLERHRVLTTDQLARLSSAPVRTARYRLDRLHTAKLVAYARPGREAGSAPRHWWVTPAGARLVAGVAPAEGKRPSAMFAAHAAAIAEVWLALVEHGPAAGIAPDGWWPDRAGWQEWRPGPRHAGEPQLLTPDAVLTADVAAGEGAAEAVAFVEVDLATMSQTQLRAKLANYLAYADDRAWAGTWPHCPPLLLVTTTEARARTWIRAAGKRLQAHRRVQGRQFWVRGRDRGEIARAERLVVAACGLVRDPAAAVTGPVWLLPTDPDPDDGETAGVPAGGPVVTLAELLAERATAQAAAAGWHALFAAEDQAAARRADLLEAARDEQLAELLGDQAAADALRVLVGADPDQFAQAHPELAEQILIWWPHRHASADPGAVAGDGDRAAVLAALGAQHGRLWAAQARTLLDAAGADPDAADPHLHVEAVDLAAGQLLPPWRLDHLHQGPPRGQVQASALGDYPAHRDQAVAQHWQALSRLARRRTSPDQLAAGYDQHHLLVCDLCQIATPRDGPYGPREAGEECWTCGRGHLTDYRHRHTIPTLTDRLDTIRALLTGHTG